MSKFLTKAKSILSRRFVLIILSVLMAIVVWLLVMDATNPVTEMTVSVDVVFENFSMPAQRQLSLVSELGVVNAEVKVSGRQSLINKLLPSDITVKADFSKIKDTGSTYLTVDPPVCSKMGIKIVDYYPKEFAVSYDRKMEMYLPVRLNYSDGILKNGYEIKSDKGEVSHFYYDQKTNTWSYEQNGMQQDLFQYNADGTLNVMMEDGQQLRVTPDEAGLGQVRMAANGGHFFAMR